MPYFAGIGGFFVDLALAAASVGVTIHALDVVGRQLGADAVERIRLAALTRDGVADRTFLRGVDLLPLLHLRGVLRGRDAGGRDESEDNEPPLVTSVLCMQSSMAETGNGPSQLTRNNECRRPPSWRCRADTRSP